MRPRGTVTDCPIQRTSNVEPKIPSAIEYLARRPLIDIKGAWDINEQSDPEDLYFTLMTYNVLAQSHVKRQLFPYCAKEALRWHFRSKLLTTELAAYDSDISCFQEMDNFSEYFGPFLESRGYSYECYYRNGPKSDVNCIAWKTSKFCLISEKKVSLEEFTLGIGCTRNVAQLVALQVRNKPSIKFIVATTHLYWRENYDHVRLAQGHALFCEVMKFRQCLGTDFFLVVAGDFNSDPNSLLMQAITRTTSHTGDGLFDEDQTGLSKYWLRDVLADFAITWVPFKSVYHEYPFIIGNSSSYPLPYTSFSYYKGVLDYILYSPIAINGCVMTPIAVRAIPDQKILEEEEALPNRFYASDHLALECKFRIRRF